MSSYVYNSLLIPQAPPSTSSCQRSAMLRRPNGCFARRSAIHRIRSPRVINTDQARLYGAAIPAVKEEGTLARPLPPSAGPILEQYPGAGPSSDQTTGKGQTGVSRVSRGAADNPRIRGNAHDSEGAGEVGERLGCVAPDSVHPTGCSRWRHETSIPKRLPSPLSKLQHFLRVGRRR